MKRIHIEFIVWIIGKLLFLDIVASIVLRIKNDIKYKYVEK